MGRSKVLLPWKASTILGSLIVQWRGIGAEVAVVHSADDLGVVREVEKFDAGAIAVSGGEMFDSIKAAAGWDRWPSDLTAIAVVLGDQPHLPAAELRKLAEFSGSHPDRICQPIFNGRGRHPVIVPVTELSRLENASEKTFAEWLRSSSVAFVEVGDPTFERDIDLPEDYEKVRSRGP